MTDKERILEIRRYTGLNFNALAKHLELNASTQLYDVKNARCGISKGLADKIVTKFPEISRAWLLTGEGEMLTTGDAKTVPAKESKVIDNDKNLRFNIVLDVLKAKGVIRNQQQFVENVGVDKSLISLVKNGKAGVSDDLLLRIEKAFPIVSTSYIKSGVGSPIEPETGKTYGGEDPEQTFVSLPLLPVDVMAGLPGDDIQGIDFATCDRYLIPDVSAAGAQYLIRVTGDSMIPEYKEGDILACRFVEDVSFWQPGRVYVLDTNQGPLVKVVYECDDAEFLVCHSFNSDRYKDFRLPKTAIRSVSLVVGVVSIRTQ